jgi:hypothetical protein
MEAGGEAFDAPDCACAREEDPPTMATSAASPTVSMRGFISSLPFVSVKKSL